MSDHVSIGLLTRVFPASLVDSVVEECGRKERRHRLLPARLATYFTLALALFPKDSYEDVILNLTAGLEWESGWARRWRPPSKGALFFARARLDEQVLKTLFAKVAAPFGRERVAGLVLTAVDGTVLDVADTRLNEECFGRPRAKEGARAAFPQVRVLALAECSTHAIVDAEIGPLECGEQRLAGPLADRFDPSLLVLFDRGFFSYDLWKRAAATGAGLCFRMKSSHVLPVVEELADGSYRSKIYPSPKARRADADGIDVRVVEYTVGAGDEATAYRLATTLLDPAQATAGRLAEAYHRRWDIETAFDEIKTHQGGPSLVLRSKSPQLVRQEVWAFLCVHYAIRWLIADALPDDIPPRRGSFTAALREAVRSVQAAPGFSPLGAG